MLFIISGRISRSLATGVGYYPIKKKNWIAIR